MTDKRARRPERVCAVFRRGPEILALPVEDYFVLPFTDHTSGGRLSDALDTVLEEHGIVARLDALVFSKVHRNRTYYVMSGEILQPMAEDLEWRPTWVRPHMMLRGRDADLHRSLFLELGISTAKPVQGAITAERVIQSLLQNPMLTVEVFRGLVGCPVAEPWKLVETPTGGQFQRVMLGTGHVLASVFLSGHSIRWKCRGHQGWGRTYRRARAEVDAVLVTQGYLLAGGVEDDAVE